MPIYEYQCLDCNHSLEALQKVSDQPLQECPSCGESALKKKVSAAAFRLKGGGWYETDFKTGNKKNIAGDQSTSESGSAAAGKGGSSGGESSSGTDKSGSSDGGSDKSSAGKDSSSKGSTGNSTATV